jgi:signal transduction histidine kinase
LTVNATSAATGEDKVNILLVDDQPARLMSYDAILTVLGQNLVHARSGTEALARLMEADYAAILLDINMPGMDGFETAALIHQHPRFEKTPIIFVTAVHVTDLDRLKGYELGAVDYVYVPVVPEILRGKVQVLVELYRQRRELERLNKSLAEANAALQAEQARELEALNATLAQANAELAQTNRTLQEEIAERVRAQEALEAADRRKDDFLAMLSHELRNPLAAIQGSIELMQRKRIDDPELQWARDVVARQNRHLTRLIDDLLDVSRITRGKLTLQKEPVELREVAQLAVETARPLMEARQHKFTIELPDAPLHVEGDAVRLTQVISNLLTNAAKYTDEGGHIQLVVEPRGGSGSAGEASIRVTDNGRGISTEAMPRLFEPSTHEERLNSGAHGGLGIGLIVVRGLVEMHGGVVEVASEGHGRGSVFTVKLPLLPVEKLTLQLAPTHDSASIETTSEGTGLRILVVDDNQDSAISMTLLLELQGHEVHVAHAGLAALRLAAEKKPDVILLDIGMPGMNGFEVAKQLRAQEEFAHTLLVAITGYGRASDVKQTQSAGFDHHLVKPVDYDKLQAVLASGRSSARVRRDIVVTADTAERWTRNTSV